MFVSDEGNRDLKFGQAGCDCLQIETVDNFANSIVTSSQEPTTWKEVITGCNFFTGITTEILNRCGFLTANVFKSDGPEGCHDRVIERYRGQLADLA